MELGELKHIFNKYLKRDPNKRDQEAHIKKSFTSFESEILNCDEYKKIQTKTIEREYIVKEDKKIYIYDLEELDKITLNFPRVPLEMYLFEHFIDIIKKKYTIVDDIDEADLAFIPIDFTKLIYIGPNNSYSTIPEGCPPTPPGNGIDHKTNTIKFFWDLYVKPNLKESKIPHFILYSYVLYEIDFSYIPRDIYILSYENEVSLNEERETYSNLGIFDRIITIPYSLNEPNIFDDIGYEKTYDLGWFGTIDWWERPNLFYYRNFIKLMDFSKYKFLMDDYSIKRNIGINYLNVPEKMKMIKYLFVLRGDTPTRSCFYQCFSNRVVPIIFEEELNVYGKLLTSNKIEDSCLVLPSKKNINDEDYAILVEKIIEEELSNPKNYEEKIKNHYSMFEELNYFRGPEYKAITNIIDHISNAN